MDYGCEICLLYFLEQMQKKVYFYLFRFEEYYFNKPWQNTWIVYIFFLKNSHVTSFQQTPTHNLPL